MTLYEDFDALSAELLAKLDNELQTVKIAMLQHFPQLDLSAVLPVKERIISIYGKDVRDTSSLLSVMRTNEGYKVQTGCLLCCGRMSPYFPIAESWCYRQGCGTPLAEVNDGRFKPASESRLYWEDIPFGLCILKHLAEMLGNLPVRKLRLIVHLVKEATHISAPLPHGNISQVPTICELIFWHQAQMGKEYLLPSGMLNPLAMSETGAPGRLVPRQE